MKAQFISGFSKAKNKVMEFLSLRIQFSKDILIRIENYKEHKLHMMELTKEVTTKIKKEKEKENLSGTMDKLTKEIGQKEENMVMELGRVQKEIDTRDSG